MKNTDWIRRLQQEGEDTEFTTVEDEQTEIRRPANITQHTLLSYIVGNMDAWSIIDPILKSEYFDDQYQVVVDLLKEHTQNYKQMPSLPIIRMKTGTMLDEYPDAKDPRTSQWLLDEVQTFCRHRATEIEIKRASEAIQKDSSRSTLELIFKNFKEITEISLEPDLGIEVHYNAKPILNEDEKEIIRPTGYKHLDRVVKGLPCPGLVMLAGSSGLGKSVTLANFGVNYCEQGDFVVYITLELAEKRIFQRICSMMTDVPIYNIYKDKDQIGDHMEYRIESGNDGLFFVKKMSMTGTTTANIHAYLKELTMKIGRKPTVLIVDYLDLLHPRTNIRDLGNIHVKDKYVAEETYALCEDWNVLGLTASQLVKNNSEMGAFDHAKVAGGTPKMNTMDYAFEITRKDGDFFLSIMKGRYGGEGTRIPMYWNRDTLRITDTSDEEFYRVAPRFDPNFQRNEANKTSAAQIRAVNKDAQKVKTETVIDRIISSNPDFFGDN